MKINSKKNIKTSQHIDNKDYMNGWHKVTIKDGELKRSIERMLREDYSFQKDFMFLDNALYIRESENFIKILEEMKSMSSSYLNSLEISKEKMSLQVYRQISFNPPNQTLKSDFFSELTRSYGKPINYHFLNTSGYLYINESSPSFQDMYEIALRLGSLKGSRPILSSSTFDILYSETSVPKNTTKVKSSESNYSDEDLLSKFLVFDTDYLFYYPGYMSTDERVIVQYFSDICFDSISKHNLSPELKNRRIYIPIRFRDSGHLVEDTIDKYEEQLNNFLRVYKKDPQIFKDSPMGKILFGDKIKEIEKIKEDFVAKEIDKFLSTPNCPFSDIISSNKEKIVNKMKEIEKDEKISFASLEFDAKILMIRRIIHELGIIIGYNVMFTEDNNLREVTFSIMSDDVSSFVRFRDLATEIGEEHGIEGVYVGDISVYKALQHSGEDFEYEYLISKNNGNAILINSILSGNEYNINRRIRPINSSTVQTLLGMLIRFFYHEMVLNFSQDSSLKPSANNSNEMLTYNRHLKNISQMPLMEAIELGKKICPDKSNAINFISQMSNVFDSRGSKHPLFNQILNNIRDLIIREMNLVGIEI